jgi:sterol-4alpha-carboxylate 3-dehydrogenase (decarboxylating)
MAASSPFLGTVLVIGGCGFIGHHLVQQLISDPDCGSVVVLDRNTDVNNTVEGAEYVRAPIARDTLRQLVQRIRPHVIFHVASPRADSRDQSVFAATNIEGTRVILAVAKEEPSVEALVYTSSCDVYAGGGARAPHVDVLESQPLWPRDDRSNEYNRTKAVGDDLVLAANGKELCTASLRPGHVYGVGQSQGMTEALDVGGPGQKLVQVGDGSNFMEVALVDNVAAAHILAAKALLDPAGHAGGKVDGEAFNISDGHPIPFWHHIRVIWSAAQDREISAEEVSVIPSWVMAAVVWLVGWAMYLMTLGMVLPPASLRRQAYEYCTMHHTYNMDKARGRLRYNPRTDHDAELRKAVKWEMARRKAAKEKSGGARNGNGS